MANNLQKKKKPTINDGAVRSYAHELAFDMLSVLEKQKLLKKALEDFKKWEQ